jgi:ABC-2 type transport system ATP-binding protein
MIQIENVTKIYSGKLKAVDAISLTVNDGEIIGFIGPNGAGKTTTIKMMTGILSPDTGSVMLNGIDIAKNPIEAKRQFGLVTDNPDIFLRLKGIEYLNFMADIYDVSEADRRERIQRLAETFEMTSALNDKILSYSHGMRQKIVVLGVLVHNPSIWILEDGKTVFFSTHVLEVAEKLCHKVAIIDKGKIFYFGTLDNLKKDYPDKSLEDIFLEVTHHA